MSLAADEIATFRTNLDGPIFLPGEPEYENARRVWNARIERHPAIVLRPSDVDDVRTAVRLTRSVDRSLTVKAGGHHISGSAVHDDAVLLDLSALTGIRTDADSVTVGGGATWGAVDRATAAIGRATPGGQDPNIGVAGLTLGGGVGWLSRRYGLACDNILSAAVVLADGSLVRASESTDDDLFWAIRGGGGRFGVVTRLRFRTYPVDEVVAGSLVFPIESASSVLRDYRELMADAPRSVRPLVGLMTLPPSSPLAAQVTSNRVCIVIVCLVDRIDAGLAALAPLRERDDCQVDSLRSRRYHRFQRAGESADRARTALRSRRLSTLTDGAIRQLVDCGTAVPGPGATVFISPRGGAETDPESTETAYPHRYSHHHVLVETRWTDSTADSDHLEWVESCRGALAAWTTDVADVNFHTGDAHDGSAAELYGSNLARLRRLKQRYDPENCFGSSHGFAFE